jgi:hypothetical protein
MLFPTLGAEINPIIPPLLAFSVSLFSSIAGVSGSFRFLPFHMSFLAYTNPSVSNRICAVGKAATIPPFLCHFFGLSLFAVAGAALAADLRLRLPLPSP